ncbi:MAG: glycosyltransferase [Sedimentisphaerales bacterium]
MRVCILTEAGERIGFGHITRCTSIYQAFEEIEVRPELIVNGDETVHDFVKGKNCKVFDWVNDREKLFAALGDTDIVFIDSYLADYDLYKKISDAAGVGVYFDDNIRIEYPKGFVVNGAVFAERMPYPETNSVRYLLGTQYSPIRREFWDVPEKSIHNTLETAVITFGGADIRNLTPKILKLLQDNYPELLIKVIVGRGFQNIAEIEEYEDNNTKLIYCPNAAEMRDIMFWSDVAISSGGQTSYELARVGVPTIGICVADNQLQNLKGWQEAGFLKYMCWYNNEDMKERLESSLKELACIDVRAKMSQAGSTLVDGKGPSRIVSALGVG